MKQTKQITLQLDRKVHDSNTCPTDLRRWFLKNMYGSQTQLAGNWVKNWTELSKVLCPTRQESHSSRSMSKLYVSCLFLLMF